MSKEKTKRDGNWYLVIIEDEQDLPGKSIFDIIQLLLTVIKFNFVIMNDIEGAVTHLLQQKKNTILYLKEVLPLLLDVVQFDWGNFFLFINYPFNLANSGKEESYSFIISQTDTTIRAIDDTYIYIYTQYKEIVDIIKENYKIESVTINTLNKLEFPD